MPSNVMAHMLADHNIALFYFILQLDACHQMLWLINSPSIILLYFILYNKYLIKSAHICNYGIVKQPTLNIMLNELAKSHNKLKKK